MYDATRDDVRELACELFQRLCLVPGAIQLGQPNQPTREGFLDKVLDAVAAAGGRWDASVTIAMMATSSKRMDPANAVAAPFGSQLTSLCRCVTQALAVVTDHGEDVPGPERDALRAFLSSHPEFRHLLSRVPLIPIPPATTDGPTQITFRFPFVPPRSRTPIVAEGTVAIPAVDVREAPVVATLSPDGGRPFEIRTFEGHLLRPVFAPGGWEPIDLASFVRASRDAPAWVDNPFLPPAPWDASILPLDHVAVAPGTLRAAAAEALDVVRSEHEARGAGLVVVDGIVHVTCVEPLLHMSMARRDSKWGSVAVGNVRLVWSLGEHLDAYTEMRTDRFGAVDPVFDFVAGYDVLNKGAGTWRSHGLNVSQGFGFRLGDAEALAEVASACAEGMRELDLGRVDLRKVRFKVSSPNATWDADRFPPSSEPMLEAIGGLCEHVGGPWTALLRAGEAVTCDDRSKVSDLARVLSVAPDGGDKFSDHRSPEGIRLGFNAVGLDRAGRVGFQVVRDLAARDLRRIAEHGPRIADDRGIEDEVAGLSL